MGATRHYDFVYLTNTPSFYKLNLCEAISHHGKSILVVFYGYGADAVNRTLSENSDWNFDFHFLHNGNAASRSKIHTWKRLRKLMRSVDCTKVIFAGWLAPEYNLYSFFSPKKKNLMVVESTIYESSLRGTTGWVKRRIIKRMSGALPSGKPHRQLIEQGGFKEDCHTTGSVGIFNMPGRPGIHIPNESGFKYLYIGRLTGCKNLRFLVERFNDNGKPLTIVGNGELEQELKNMAKPNITFTGFVENDRLGDIYKNHDVFILPSISETWGLVVEEAIYWGLPVIVSDRVGSKVDMVENLGTGRIFELGNPDSFNNAIVGIEENYRIYADAVEAVDFNKRVQEQINAYTSFIL